MVNEYDLLRIFKDNRTGLEERRGSGI
jgi:hypothetical protein